MRLVVPEDEDEPDEEERTVEVPVLRVVVAGLAVEAERGEVVVCLAGVVVWRVVVVVPGFELYRGLTYEDELRLRS